MCVNNAWWYLLQIYGAIMMIGLFPLELAGHFMQCGDIKWWWMEQKIDSKSWLIF